MSASKSYIVLNNKKMFKAAAAGVIAAAADNVVMKNQDLQSCAVFGGATAAGILGVSLFIEDIMTMMPTYAPLGTATKGVEQRVIETMVGSASSYAVNFFLLKNEYSAQQMLPKIAIVAVADVLAETAADMFMSETIDPFSAT